MTQRGAAQEYDPNGNLTSDMNKSIFKIEYNFLNLPVQIFFNNGAKIKILYDAAGTKLRKTYTDQNNNVTTQDYDGGIEYYDEVLNMIPHPEGRVAVIKKEDRLTYRYEYVITDHLGNARVTFADVNEDQVIGIEDIIQENHYYPFGLDMQGAWTPPAGEWNRHKYNGKDWNKEEALNWYDYGARWYDPAVGRWWSVDPLAEVSRRWSPYAYCYDNPLRFVDPDGMGTEDVIINGADAEWAVQNLNADSGLNIERNPATGKLSVAPLDGPISPANALLIEAINNPNIIVEIEATNADMYNDTRTGENNIPLLPAGYLGSQIDPNFGILAKQIVNMTAIRSFSRILEESPSMTLTHEINEAYIGAKIDPGGTFETGRDIAHKAASDLDGVNNVEMEYNFIHEPNGRVTAQGRIKDSGMDFQYINGIDTIIIR